MTNDLFWKDINSTQVCIISVPRILIVDVMNCRIKAFGISREIVGGKIVELQVPDGQTVAELKTALFKKYPALAALRSVYVAVNNEYADENAPLKEGDEVALIPPVSGG